MAPCRGSTKPVFVLARHLGEVAHGLSPFVFIRGQSILSWWTEPDDLYDLPTRSREELSKKDDEVIELRQPE